ncbi:carbon-nitrogen family hydrolase [Streptosporangium carneum]|uniref:Hydrolase n=1 Tax=Streptosporangium carneum TaxID=47481 RepID=A0A9W6MDJ9_9ACTN|nr:carbon-nitrogen family hydrolase [Streptosporangium carneum]GLK10584.1 hydrolase [Streptosporangium carneum]
MRIALVQVASPPEETPDARRTRVGRMVSQARGADLVVLPELWAAGYFAFDAYEDRAEPLDGPTVAAGREWARELGAHVHIGSVVERDRRGRLFNTAVLIGPAGTIAHTYRKVHVFGYASREAELLTPGERLDVADTVWGRVGATTCYDLRFPELWRGLVDRGAQTVVVPAAWPAARREHWRLFTSCRAVEQQLVVVACNAVGTQDGGVELGGASRVVDPWGTVLAEAGQDEGITFCEVDPAVVDRVRAEFPVLADRRWPVENPADGGDADDERAGGGPGDEESGGDSGGEG